MLTHDSSGDGLMLCSFPTVLVIGTSLDLYKHRRRTLGPRGLVLTASLSLLTVIAAITMWSHCILTGGYYYDSKCPNLNEGISGYTTWPDLAVMLPYMAIIDLIL